MKKERHKTIIAVYLLLKKGKEVLLMQRANTGFCDGQYGLPAGHVEADESLASAAAREMREELGIGIDPKDLELVHVRDKNADDGHRLDVFFVCHVWEGEPVNAEAHKCSELRWVPLKALPEETIPYIRESVECIERAQNYSQQGWS